MTRDELVGKYRGCAARVFKSEKLERSIKILESLETLPAVASLADALSD
jgi:hypothetical protein